MQENFIKNEIEEVKTKKQLNSIIRNIETKSLISGHIVSENSQDFLQTVDFCFEENIDDQNFFIKHAQILKTSLNHINFIAPEKIEPQWFDPEDFSSLTGKKDNSVITPYSLTLKESYFHLMIPSGLGQDVISSVSDYMCNNLMAKINTFMIQTLLYGDGKNSPLGILNNFDASPNIQYNKKIIESLTIALDKMRELDNRNSKFIILMHPNFFNQYCVDSLLIMNFNIVNMKSFFGYPVYSCAYLKEEHQCLIINLHDNLLIAYNPQMQTEKTKEVFLEKIGFKFKIGSYLKKDFNKRSILLKKE